MDEENFLVEYCSRLGSNRVEPLNIIAILVGHTHAELLSSGRSTHIHAHLQGIHRSIDNGSLQERLLTAKVDIHIASSAIDISGGKSIHPAGTDAVVEVLDQRHVYGSTLSVVFDGASPHSVASAERTGAELIERGVLQAVDDAAGEGRCRSTNPGVSAIEAILDNPSVIIASSHK